MVVVVVQQDGHGLPKDTEDQPVGWVGGWVGELSCAFFAPGISCRFYEGRIGELVDGWVAYQKAKLPGCVSWNRFFSRWVRAGVGGWVGGWVGGLTKRRSCLLVFL